MKKGSIAWAREGRTRTLKGAYVRDVDDGREQFCPFWFFFIITDVNAFIELVKAANFINDNF